MLHNEDILCIAPNPWDDIWRRRHHLMTRLARDNRVLWVEPPRLFLSWPVGRAGGPARRRLLRPVCSGLLVHQPWTPVPFAESALRKGIGIIHRLNVLCSVLQVKLAIQRLGMTAPVLWLYYTEISEALMGRCSQKLTVCDVFDKYSAFSHHDAWGARRVEKQEEQLLRKVDLVFTVSEQLSAYCRQFNENVFLVPNGVDTTLWGTRPDDAPRPPRLNLSHPVLGYVGSIYDKIDLALLLDVSRAYPKASLLLIGPVKLLRPENRQLLSQLERRPNVSFVGSQLYADLAGYYEMIDFALLPYAPTEQVKYAEFPAKLFEYMAARKPIVAMDTFRAQDFGGVVDVAHTKEQFVECIGHLMGGDHTARVERGYQIASQNSWDVRVQQIGRIVEEHLPKGKGSA